VVGSGLRVRERNCELIKFFFFFFLYLYLFGWVTI
jgi:hypothetical protein